LLQREDFRTDVWRRLKKQLDARLAELREQNDGLTLTSDKTATIRGQIVEVKNLLAAPQRAASEPAEPGASWLPQPDA